MLVSVSLEVQMLFQFLVVVPLAKTSLLHRLVSQHLSHACLFVDNELINTQALDSAVLKTIVVED